MAKAVARDLVGLAFIGTVLWLAWSGKKGDDVPAQAGSKQLAQTPPPTPPKTKPAKQSPFLIVGDTAAVTRPAPACVDLKTVDRLVELSRDQTAYQRYWLEQALMGQCTVLSDGNKVVIEEHSFWSNAYRVRMPGQTVSYWMIRTFLAEAD